MSGGSAAGRVELAIRTDGTDDYWFLINRTAAPVEVPGINGTPLIGPQPSPSGVLPLPTRGVSVPHHPTPTNDQHAPKPD